MRRRRKAGMPRFTNNVLELAGVSHRFPAPEGARSGRPIDAVVSVDLTVREGQVVGVVGRSGCGKTTLGRIAAGLLKPTEGRVLINGKSPFGLDRDGWRALRRDARMIFQSPGAALNPFLKVRELLEEPLVVHESGFEKKVRRWCVEDLSRDLGFDRLDQFPRALSGGEKRRASLVRALLIKARLLVADEPTSELDATLKVHVLRAIEKRRREWNAGMLLISHHLGVVEQLASEILVLCEGRVVERVRVRDGRIAELKHPESKKLWEAARLSPDAVGTGSAR
jgi:ABC-type glutathione transport system ATPase component